MRALPEEVTALISDLEQFLNDGFKGENLNKKVKEKKDAFIKRIKEVKLGFPHDFNDKSDDSDDEEDADSNNDAGSLKSERTDKDDEAFEGAQQSPPVAALDLKSVFKAGYLEKRRKDHSFFGTEWQKRWCALSHQTFYYYGNEKDRQQKGEFSIDGYSAKMNSTLRKDSKKDCCFEISAPDKRVYQFCASSVKEAEEWVKQIDFVLEGMSGFIPEDEEEGELYDDIANPEDQDIYESIPEEEMRVTAKASPKMDAARKPVPPTPPAADYPNYYQGLWDCIADQPDELSFKRGDSIYILSKEYQNYGWWVGEKSGAIGIVPKDYLMELYTL